jgi:medium-chain acyl-[acyl-carrier-protein] hydrolase
MNLDTRRLVRDPNLLDADGICSENVIETPADKVQMPKDVELELVMTHKVAYSDVDMNAHANNAMYMHWAMDAVDYQTASTRQLKAMTINFNHETKQGDKVDIYRVIREDESGLNVYIEGKVEDSSAFIVKLLW